MPSSWTFCSFGGGGVPSSWTFCVHLEGGACPLVGPFVHLGEGVPSSWNCSCACVQDLHKGTQMRGIFLLASFPGLPRLLFFGLRSASV